MKVLFVISLWVIGIVFGLSLCAAGKRADEQMDQADRVRRAGL